VGWRFTTVRHVRLLGQLRAHRPPRRTGPAARPHRRGPVHRTRPPERPGRRPLPSTFGTPASAARPWPTHRLCATGP